VINLEHDIDTIKKRIKEKRYSDLEVKDTSNKAKYLKNLLSRILITIIMLLISVIYINGSNKNLLQYKEHVLTKSFSFAPFKNWYQKNFGNIIPVKIEDPVTSTVSSEKLSYSDISPYQNGFKLTVANSTVINTITSGIVVYIGEKDGYGNVVIVQGIDGVDIWYGNITNTSVQLYDYVEENNILGESNGEHIYFVLTKDGQHLNYEEYINQT